MLANVRWWARAYPTIVVGVLAAMWAAHATGAESTYPTRSIRLIVASAPGGPNDLVARALATPWSEMLGRAIVVDNRAGAAGVIATDIAAKASPDGYTLLVGFQGPLVIAPNLTGTPYDTLKDFAPISLAVSSPFLLIVHPRVQAKSLKELVALAKTRPGKMNFGSGGTGIGSHMTMELFKHISGTDIVHVPYKGAGPGLTALIAGETDMMLAAVGAALPHVKADRLRAIAVGGDKRAASLPELPTFRESGYAIDASSWYGLVAPRSTPRAVLSKLHDTVVRVLNAPTLNTQLTNQGFNVAASDPAQFGKLIREELATWGKVIDAAGLKGVR
ncbi:MAG TPA: tripartite tricarboxylate transporter substrate binding protein [Burkholderiales bacterium]|nr:tripartite tricarboxylate transporter substrate binding protein [Burkholderiales bacterium]